MGRAITTMIASATATVLLMAIVLHDGGVAAQEPVAAPGPASPDCFTALLGLSDCLTYVESGSNLTKPDKPCCPELAGLVKDAPICLCSLLGNTSNSYGIDVDVNRALKLPGVCKVDTPPASLCAVLGGIPVAAPTTSESPATSPGQQSPTTNRDNNAASTTADAAAMATLLVLVVIGFLPTFF